MNNEERMVYMTWLDMEFDRLIDWTRWPEPTSSCRHVKGKR